jgi:hypothetical protein
MDAAEEYERRHFTHYGCSTCGLTLIKFPSNIFVHAWTTGHGPRDRHTPMPYAINTGSTDLQALS